MENDRAPDEQAAPGRQGTDVADADTDVDGDLTARVRLLELENARLRDERNRANEARYRRGAAVFFVLGGVSAGAGLLLPAAQTVLFSLAGIGLFSAVLTYYLTTSQFISTSTIERVYLAHAETLSKMIGELGLQDVAVYVPTADADELGGVRLFVPQQATYEIPDELNSVFVVTDDGRRRGIAVHPVGAALFEEFYSKLRDPLSEQPERLAEQISAALVEDFDLVSRATAAYDAENDHVTVEVRGSELGTVDRFDHPVASFLGTGLARGLDRPVRTEVHVRDDGSSLVVCSLDADPQQQR